MAAELTSVSPIDGAVLGSVAVTPLEAIAGVVAAAGAAFTRWRDVPAPRRGELVRLFSAELRAEKRRLAALVTLEVGKIGAEAEGEVQEMIDVCDFAVGLSRQLHGLSIASERPGHRMAESWHPLGPCAVISAFNFPVAVWCWNAALALVCGDPVIWKPSEKAPLTAAAALAILARALDRFGADAPPDLVQLVNGGPEQGMTLAADGGVALVSATGSTRMGRAVAPLVAARFGRVLLELGGNAAMIVCPSADLDLAVRAIVFSAIGTAGQRCTSLRRLIVHRSVAAPLLERLRRAYASIPIGDPRDPATLLGPLVDEAAAVAMERALDQARADGGEVLGGGRVTSGVPGGGVYVRPALVRMPRQSAIVREETFAPLLYVLGYDDFDEALRLHNDVPQGLSGCLFTLDLREAERFVSAAGSDCGIANVNIGPSGAEIGGAFGGEKETGGGRESGSDAWKGYMRRQTVTVNFSRDLPLAQGVTFDSGG
ncbi:MAG: aldehyde dehydrogenase family protein [Planctomycetota bacterium]